MNRRNFLALFALPLVPPPKPPATVPDFFENINAGYHPLHGYACIEIQGADGFTHRITAKHAQHFSWTWINTDGKEV